MSVIVVNGGKPLSGTVAASGSKNAALPCIAASLLNEQPVTLRNVARLRDVSVISDVLRTLGAEVAREEPDHTIHINAARVTSCEAPYELVNKMRASFLVMGPLLARFGEARVPLPGGCQIGPRPVGEHMAALRALGAEISQEEGQVVARARKLKGAEIILNITSVGATENTIMAASLAEGTTEIHNAAMEPEVIDLCRFLTRCGVEIDGVGTKVVTVHGQPVISAKVEYTVIPDRVEAGTYLTAIAATGGSGTVKNVMPEHIEALILKLRECGLEVEPGEDSVTVRHTGRLSAADLRTAPYPGFPTDLQPQLTCLLTAAEGVSTVTETIFERRLMHAPELARMGAKVRLKGDSAIIEGPRELTGVPVEANDLRCAAALVIAGLMAQGETRINGLTHLVRGYEQMPQKFAALGGDVQFEDSNTHRPADAAER